MVDDFLTDKINAVPKNQRMFLIGEDQRGRVVKAAEAVGAKNILNFWPNNMKFEAPLTSAEIAASVDFNKYLIRRLHASGFSFGDVGPKAAEATSLWYKAELETLEESEGSLGPCPAGKQRQIDQTMNSEADCIVAAIQVPDIEAALEVYVRRWCLFQISNQIGNGPNAFAMLDMIDEFTRFKLVIRLQEKTDTLGRTVPVAKSAYFSLPKSDFWQWVDKVFGTREAVESVPWQDCVVLRDPFGHMFVIYTTKPPP